MLAGTGTGVYDLMSSHYWSGILGVERFALEWCLRLGNRPPDWPPPHWQQTKKMRASGFAEKVLKRQTPFPMP